MAATKQQKLDSLATKQTSGEFHIEPPPKLAELSAGYGFKRGQEMFDEQLSAWVVNLEKSINKQFRENDVSAGNPL